MKNLKYINKKMSEEEKMDMYLMTEKDYKAKYDNKLDMNKLKKFVSCESSMKKVAAIDEAIEKVDEPEEEMETMA